MQLDLSARNEFFQPRRIVASQERLNERQPVEPHLLAPGRGTFGRGSSSTWSMLLESSMRMTMSGQPSRSKSTRSCGSRTRSVNAKSASRNATSEVDPRAGSRWPHSRRYKLKAKSAAPIARTPG